MKLCTRPKLLALLVALMSSEVLSDQTCEQQEMQAEICQIRNNCYCLGDYENLDFTDLAAWYCPDINCCEECADLQRTKISCSDPQADLVCDPSEYPIGEGKIDNVFENSPCKDVNVEYDVCVVENDDSCFSLDGDEGECTISTITKFLEEGVDDATDQCAASFLDKTFNFIKTCCKPCASQAEEFYSCLRPNCNEHTRVITNAGLNGYGGNGNPFSFAVHANLAASLVILTAALSIMM